MRDVEAYEEKEAEAPLNEEHQNDTTFRAVDQSPLEEIQDSQESEAENTLSAIESQIELKPGVSSSPPVKPQSTEAVAKEMMTPESPLASPLKEEIKDNSIFEDLPPVAPAPVETPPVVEPEIEEPTAQVEKNSEPQVEPAPAPAGKPEWAESEFQAMMFKVAGLTLAVPLIELNGVVECDLTDVTSMPGHADFYLGLLSYLEKSVPLVDTARFVLPPDKLKILAGDDPKERITRVVMIQDCKYGLACDEVNEVITLSPDSVRWRSQRTQRRWLAGTVVDHMCALIDANAFAELLADRAPIQEFRE